MPKRKIHKHLTLVLTACAIIIVAVVYLLHNRQNASTNDAYINANVIQISPRVSGQVTRLMVKNNQFVPKGKLLFELDQAPFKIALEKAGAELEIAKAELLHSQLTTARTEELVRKKALPIQSHDDDVAKLRNATAGLQLTLALLNEAKLNLQYARIFAPVSGWITNMSLREGDVVTANQPLFALIDNDEFWVDANFKETELKNIRPEQPAKIAVDMYPQHLFHGIVESISGGSGVAFSLLPPQNATGNWVKITQRIPVKVRVTDPDTNYPLRVGATATVNINTAKIK